MRFLFPKDIKEKHKDEKYGDVYDPAFCRKRRKDFIDQGIVQDPQVFAEKHVVTYGNAAKCPYAKAKDPSAVLRGQFVKNRKPDAKDPDRIARRRGDKADGRPIQIDGQKFLRRGRDHGGRNEDPQKDT